MWGVCDGVFVVVRAQRSRFSISDKFGRVTVFGLEGVEGYKNHLEEQLFSTDYQEILIDNDGRAIDPGTNLPTHIAPTGALINFAGAAYDPQPPRSLCPSPSSLQATRAERQRLLEAAKQLDATMQEAYIYSARARSRAGRESSRLLSVAGAEAKHRGAHAGRGTTRVRAMTQLATINSIRSRNDYASDNYDDADDFEAFTSASELDWSDHEQQHHNLRRRTAPYVMKRMAICPSVVCCSY